MSKPERPAPSAVWNAIKVFLQVAYESAPPAAVEGRLARLRECPAEQFFDCDVFERDVPDDPQRYFLRLGNRYYPHMKLVVEHLASRNAWFFRADTHDRHFDLDPSHPEFDEFQALMARNQAVADAIEAAWLAAGVATFRAFLHRDLEERRARS